MNHFSLETPFGYEAKIECLLFFLRFYKIKQILFLSLSVWFFWLQIRHFLKLYHKNDFCWSKKFSPKRKDFRHQFGNNFLVLFAKFQLCTIFSSWDIEVQVFPVKIFNRHEKKWYLAEQKAFIQNSKFFSINLEIIFSFFVQNFRFEGFLVPEIFGFSFFAMNIYYRHKKMIFCWAKCFHPKSKIFSPLIWKYFSRFVRKILGSKDF